MHGRFVHYTRVYAYRRAMSGCSVPIACIGFALHTRVYTIPDTHAVRVCVRPPAFPTLLHTRYPTARNTLCVHARAL